jgi:hypothetical protein
LESSSSITCSAIVGHLVGQLVAQSMEQRDSNLNS